MKSGKRKISRRKFVNLTAAGTAAAIIAPGRLVQGGTTLQQTWPENASQYRFHMIGHAHIDPVWLWPWTEGMSIVHSTFRSALDRMNETPDFTFVSSSARFYQWVADNDPLMMQEIQKRVKEGRWNIVGGWWVEPDVNIPSGEAMVRQGLYGQLTFQKLLGQRATVAFNPDSFGHTGTLPQIIKQQGMKNYIFMRPGINEKNIPSDLFWWESPDGSRVLAYRIQISYNDNASVRTRVERILSQAGSQPMKSMMAYYGAGDHGGGATKLNIQSIEELKVEKGAPALFFSTPEKYFTEVRSDRNLELPVIKDDLQHHAPGCYTAESAIKKGNRQSEAALVTAEKICAVGLRSWDAAYPLQDFTNAWKKVLFLQFHDSLAGSSLYEHSETAREGYGFAIDTAKQAMYTALQKLEWQIKSEDPASQYLVVFNPHAWETKSLIEYDFDWNNSHKSSRVEDEQGNVLDHQWTAASTETGSRKKLIINTPIPAFGYRQIRLLDAESPAPSSPVKATQNTLENEFLKVNVSPSGTADIFDKKAGLNVFSGNEGGCKALIIDDPSDTWSHDIKSFSKIIGAFGNGKTKMLEQGPLRATLRSVTTYGSSTLTIDWSLVSGASYLEAKATLDWKEHLKMLKLSFPVNTASPAATYETPYGFIERGINGDEDPGQRWIDVTGNKDGKTFGVAVINDAKYGYSVHGTDMRISIARSAVYAHHNPRVLDMNAEHLWMDQGIQTFRLRIVPHADTWKERNIPVLAEEFLTPALCIYQGIHGGKMPKSGSFLSTETPNVIISSVKQAEFGKDTIIRCVETSGTECTASIDMKFAAKKWSGDFRPLEIKTLKVNAAGEVKEVTLMEE
jgi:alpha-mannosidase